MNNQQICAEKMQSAKILFMYNNKNKVTKQIYTIITDKEILIGGTNEIGYMLRLFPENKPSNTCITYIDILRLLRGEIIKQHVFQVRIIK